MSKSRFDSLLLLSCCILLLGYLPKSLSLKAVTLASIIIFDTHEWISAKPTIYFYCQGDNKILLPDVKDQRFLYKFNGEESWQPLTELPDKKCKRCGLYESDSIKSDDVFDEWELCPDDFSDGIYRKFKEKEFNATLICSQCVTSSGFTASSSVRDMNENLAAVIFVGIIASIVAAIATVGAYKYWLKRKRERDQARFLKLFEDDDDDIEDELGL